VGEEHAVVVEAVDVEDVELITRATTRTTRASIKIKQKGLGIIRHLRNHTLNPILLAGSVPRRIILRTTVIFDTITKDRGMIRTTTNNRRSPGGTVLCASIPLLGDAATHSRRKDMDLKVDGY
jgi:hypothetical protein